MVNAFIQVLRRDNKFIEIETSIIPKKAELATIKSFNKFWLGLIRVYKISSIASNKVEISTSF